MTFLNTLAAQTFAELEKAGLTEQMVRAEQARARQAGQPATKAIIEIAAARNHLAD